MCGMGRGITLAESMGVISKVPDNMPTEYDPDFDKEEKQKQNTTSARRQQVSNRNVRKQRNVSTNKLSIIQNRQNSGLNIPT
tara:strand:- start:1371 stop:1616 length:246 start_codon:yes stop_codon:yes gene_type:complete